MKFMWKLHNWKSSPQLAMTALVSVTAVWGWTLRELRVEKKSLEDIFVSLTRDDLEGEPS